MCTYDIFEKERLVVLRYIDLIPVFKEIDYYTPLHYRYFLEFFDDHGNKNDQQPIEPT